MTATVAITHNEKHRSPERVEKLVEGALDLRVETGKKIQRRHVSNPEEERQARGTR